jgi:hypothetical protein
MAEDKEVIMIKVIADIDPGRIYREIGEADNMRDAEVIARKYRLEVGPTISVQFLNTGKALRKPFETQLTTSKSKMHVDKTTQFK